MNPFPTSSTRPLPCGALVLRDRMGLGKDAVVLIFSTEGDTDPENYKDIVGNLD